MTDHPIIKLFEAQAELLDIANDPASLDDAITKLAGWLEFADLPDDASTLLINIGGILYREGLRRRMAL